MNEKLQLRFRVKNAVQPMEFFLQMNILTQKENQPMESNSVTVDLNLIGGGKNRDPRNPELISAVYFKKISENETEFSIELNIRADTLGADIKQVRLSSVYIRDFALRQAHTSLGPLYYIYPTGAYPKN
jgi:hypothetical protein